MHLNYARFSYIFDSYNVAWSFFDKGMHMIWRYGHWRLPAYGNRAKSA
jgi:hypothetical protein